MSGICAFFGHRNTVVTSELEENIKRIVRDLIARGINEFWCCEQGNFDWICRLVMFDLKKEFRFIRVCCVCAYNPQKYSQIRQESLSKMYDELTYTAEIADGPPRFAISRRNRYIAENADVVLCHLTHRSGGAYKAIKAAKNSGAEIIKITSDKANC